jgi:hypothetical protein
MELKFMIIKKEPIKVVKIIEIIYNVEFLKTKEREQDKIINKMIKVI